MTVDVKHTGTGNWSLAERVINIKLGFVLIFIFPLAVGTTFFEVPCSKFNDRRANLVIIIIIIGQSPLQNVYENQNNLARPYATIFAAEMVK